MAGSSVGKILPLIFGVILLGVIGAVGFVAYSIACDVADKASKKMEKKHVSLSRDGMKVGVKEKSAEQVSDRTQHAITKTWNQSSWPAYKSRLGWGQGSPATSPGLTPGGSTEKRNPLSRTSSART